MSTNESIYIRHCVVILLCLLMFLSDKPSPPQGPMEIVDIYANRCALLWDEPKDNGGAPVTHYLVEKMDMLKTDWEEVGVILLTIVHFHFFFVCVCHS